MKRDGFMSINDENAIVQNLKDAGCGQELIAEFLEDFRRDDISGDLKLLAAHRRLLLDNIHREQKRIDCLDYLVYKMTKESSL